MTRTYTLANVVVVPVPYKDELPTDPHFGQKVFVQDFAFATDNEEAREICEGILDANHVRSFKSMHEASVFLMEMGAVIDKLIVFHYASAKKKAWTISIKENSGAS